MQADSYRKWCQNSKNASKSFGHNLINLGPGSIVIGLGLVQNHEIVVSSCSIITTLDGGRSKSGLLTRVLKSIGVGGTEGWTGGDIDDGQV